MKLKATTEHGDGGSELRSFSEATRHTAERERAKQELEESRVPFRATFDRAPVGMARLAPDGRWLSVNRRLCEILGYTSEELLGLTLQGITDRDDLETDQDHVGRLLAGEIETYSAEKRCFRKDGSVVWVDLALSLERKPSGEPGCFIAVIEDIDRRKRTELALRRREELYRAMGQQAAENIFLVDVGTLRIIEANAAFHRSLGYAAEELKRLTLYDIVAPDEESIDQKMQHVVEYGRYFLGEKQYRRKDGSLIDVEVNLSSVSYDGREAVCIVAHDITERKQVEYSLRQSLGELLALREAAQILGSTLESEEIVSRLLEIMQRVSGLTATVISVQDQEGNWRIWRSAGLRGLWPRARYAPEAVAARQGALEDEKQHLFRLRHPNTEVGHLLGLCLPLRTRDRIVGVLEAYGSESLVEGGAAQILGSLTGQAASALENALLYGELEERERKLQGLVGELLRAQEEERRRVAYEVHDGLAQVAVAAHQHLQAFSRRHSPDSKKSQRDLERVLRLVRQTVSDARKIIANLRPTTLDDFGLAAAISLEVEHLREDGYQVDCEEELGDERLPAPVEIALFRIAQEALTNVRKHAQTRRASIELRRRGDEAYLEVRDYGCGFDPTAASVENGPGERVGLAGMRERVDLLDGKLEIRSRPGAGTCVAVAIPLPTTAEEDHK